MSDAVTTLMFGRRQVAALAPAVSTGALQVADHPDEIGGGA